MLGRLFPLLLLVPLALPAPALSADREAVIIRSTGPRDAMRKAVEALGGTVDRELANVNAISATVPAGTLAALGAMPDFKVTKDELLAPPAPHDPAGLGSGVVELGAPDRVLPATALVGLVRPGDYAFNNTLIKADAVQASGITGDGVVVAVIDSGTANNATVVPAIAGSVIGGQSFVPAAADPVTSATSTRNGAHGTWVGSMIAGHAAFLFADTSCLARAGKVHAPSSFIDGTPYGYPGATIVPMVGVAPDARLYALKVFRSSGGGSPNSWIAAAMDRVITLKKNFRAGMPSVPVSGSGTEDDPYVYDSLDVKVVNMSLGGATGIAGGDLQDELVEQMVALDISVATSAGNAGPSGITTGSPSTSLASISAAAASTPAHERIIRSFASLWGVCFPDGGFLFRPADTIQTALFSSRGPTADGRVGVSLTTAGDFNFMQAASGALNLASGTSFAAPTVAGAAALLRQAVPGASAAQIRNALVASANPRVLGDRSTRFDQGAGFLDVQAALALLRKGRVSDDIRKSHSEDEVEDNLRDAGLRVQELSVGRAVSGDTGLMLPGERREWYLEVGRDVGAVRLDVTGVTAELPAAEQNQLFGDDVIVQIQNAKTSTDDVRYFNFLLGPATATVDDLDTGVVRLTFLGDWTNAGRARGSFTVTALPRAGAPAFSRAGTVADGEWVAIPVTIPAGTSAARFELSWKGDWGSYPTNDLDMYVIDPAGNENIDGAQLNSPERATLPAPAPGEYTVLVNGFTVFGDHGAGARASRTDRYTLRVFLE